jgi:L-lactate dehydrogenase complex protein LldG
MSDPASMLRRIRNSLTTNGPMLEKIAALAQTPYPEGPFIHGKSDPVGQFMDELRELKGHPHRCANVDSARDMLIELLQSHKAERVLHWDERELPIPDFAGILQQCGAKRADSQVLGAPDRRRHLQDLDDVGICVSGADAAVAESGTLVVVSGPGRGRLASLLPPVHIALLPANRIVRTLPEAWSLLEVGFGVDVGHARSNISLITGPSRTADIEQTLTLGVHGPKELHVIVIDDV